MILGTNTEYWEAYHQIVKKWIYGYNIEFKKAIIAGGSIADLLLDVSDDPVDIDIFVPYEEWADSDINANTVLVTSDSQGFYGVSMLLFRVPRVFIAKVEKKGKLNIIYVYNRREDLYDVVKNFDLNYVQAGYDLMTHRFFMTDEFLDYKENRILRFQNFTGFGPIVRIYDKLARDSKAKVDQDYVFAYYVLILTMTRILYGNMKEFSQTYYEQEKMFWLSDSFRSRIVHFNNLCDWASVQKVKDDDLRYTVKLNLEYVERNWEHILRIAKVDHLNLGAIIVLGLIDDFVRDPFVLALNGKMKSILRSVYGKNFKVSMDDGTLGKAVLLFTIIFNTPDDDIDNVISILNKVDLSINSRTVDPGFLYNMIKMLQNGNYERALTDLQIRSKAYKVRSV